MVQPLTKTISAREQPNQLYFFSLGWFLPCLPIRLFSHTALKNEKCLMCKVHFTNPCLTLTSDLTVYCCLNVCINWHINCLSLWTIFCISLSQVHTIFISIISSPFWTHVWKKITNLSFATVCESIVCMWLLNPFLFFWRQTHTFSTYFKVNICLKQDFVFFSKYFKCVFVSIILFTVIGFRPRGRDDGCAVQQRH